MSTKAAFIFPGQGSQSLAMGKDFYDNSPLAKEIIDSASEYTGIDFVSLMFEQEDMLNETQYTQPAILLVSMVAHALFTQDSTLKPTLLLGHSLGEISAVCAAGALSINDAVKLVHIRGNAMKDACSDVQAGMMAVVGLSDEAVETVCQKAQDAGRKVWPANYNQDGQLVIAGLKEDLQSIQDELKGAGAKRALLLNMSVASHCALLESAKAPFAHALNEMLHDEFKAPVISNVTTQAYDTKAQALELLQEQLVMPVRYKQSIEGIANDVDIAIEFGNGKVLAGLNRRIAKELTTYNIFDMATLQKVLSELS